jgi:hypothetical protein
MGLIRPSVLLLALVMSAPALYRYFILQDLDVTDALARYLIAVPVAAVMLAFLRFVTNGYGRPKAPQELLVAPPPAPPVVEPEPITAAQAN